MSTKNHTPGIWYADNGRVLDEGGADIADCTVGIDPYRGADRQPRKLSYDEVMANAEIIAMTPVMLEALRAIADPEHCSTAHTVGALRVLARAALRKPRSRATLEAEYGQVWDADELERDFEVLGFCDVYCGVRCKFDGAEGAMEFQHYPRFYFNLQIQSRTGRLQ